ncbi:MAG TPA: beta-phosphoglucomutase family hydrolase [Anditalea sp.]|nr:beta-phosphoglucomutase family hydrolase [Anditalea sp.]
MKQNKELSFQAVILDMDGVITQTVKLHMKAWKQTFDHFLEKKFGSDYHPFETKDYKMHIDGIPRFDGVRNFLHSREIDLPEGGPNDDDGGEDTIHSIGMVKNKVFRKLLESDGIEVFPDTLEMIKKWKREGKKLAVISSSRNCEYIIESAGLTDMFEVRVDGVISEKEKLKGKPEPDIFLRAGELLDISPDKAIVIEDAILGVEAGKKGKFLLVVGVARNGEERDLENAGADIIVNKLTELEQKLNKYEK